MAPAERPAAKQQRIAKRRRTALWTLAIVVLIPVTAINVVNRLETEVPPPLWTEAALPIPTRADNGWPLIAHYHSTTISGVDLAPIDNLLAATRDAPLAELGRVFAPARSVASKIRKHTNLCSDAFQRRRMVLPCFAVDADACTTEPLDICTRLVSFAALDEASRGSARGVTRMADVLRQLNDAAANSPHPWLQARALVLLRGAIHHAAAIIKWRRGNTQPLRVAVAAISDESLPIDHLIIGSYLLKHLALREALDRTDSWLLDEGKIMRGLNAPFEHDALPPPRNHAEGWFWWFDNPVGKKMLDAVQPGADKDYLRTAELRKTVLKRREETLRLR